MARMPTIEEAYAAVPRSTYRADIYIEPGDWNDLNDKIDKDIPNGAVDPQMGKILVPTKPSPFAKGRIHLIVLGRAWKDYELQDWRESQFEKQQRAERKVISQAQYAAILAKRQALDQKLEKERAARYADRAALAAESIATYGDDSAPTCSLAPTAPPWALSSWPGSFREFSDMDPLDMSPMPDDSIFRGVRYGRWMAKRGRRLGALYGPMNRGKTRNPLDRELAKTS